MVLLFSDRPYHVPEVGWPVTEYTMFATSSIDGPTVNGLELRCTFLTKDHLVT